MGALRKSKEVLLDILFPPLCVHCKVYLKRDGEKENLLCIPCFSGIRTYETVSRDKNLTLAAVASYENGALKELIHRLKYDGFLGAGTPIEKMIRAYLKVSPLPHILPPETIIVPVPLYASRHRKRGFNQAEIIADLLAKELELPVKKDILFRIRNTPQQTGVESKAKRQKNVAGSFSAVKSVDFPPILIVDDVYTSGATMQEAAKALRQAGARRVFGFVLAKA